MWWPVVHCGFYGHYLSLSASTAVCPVEVSDTQEHYACFYFELMLTVYLSAGQIPISAMTIKCKCSTCSLGADWRRLGITYLFTTEESQQSCSLQHWQYSNCVERSLSDATVPGFSLKPNISLKKSHWRGTVIYLKMYHRICLSLDLLEVAAVISRSLR